MLWVVYACGRPPCLNVLTQTHEAKYAHDLALMRRKNSEGTDCTRKEPEAALEAMREGLTQEEADRPTS